MNQKIHQYVQTLGSTGVLAYNQLSTYLQAVSLPIIENLTATCFQRSMQTSRRKKCLQIISCRYHWGAATPAGDRLSEALGLSSINLCLTALPCPTQLEAASASNAAGAKPSCWAARELIAPTGGGGTAAPTRPRSPPKSTAAGCPGFPAALPSRQHGRAPPQPPPELAEAEVRAPLTHIFSCTLMSRSQLYT